MSDNIALKFDSNDEVFFICIVNARYRSDIKSMLPKGYYGNALAYPAVVATADDLCRNSLGYALDLVKKAKLEVTVEYMRSVADFMVMTGRRCKYTRARSFSVSDVTRAGYDEVDFGWGKAAYRRPVRGSTSDSSKLLRFVEEGEKMTTLLPITLLKS
ncbi:Benzyl alcohol O-benzoyltransferase [Linum grandiflorum]